jgi:hypothetical protein
MQVMNVVGLEAIMAVAEFRFMLRVHIVALIHAAFNTADKKTPRPYEAGAIDAFIMRLLA